MEGLKLGNMFDIHDEKITQLITEIDIKMQQFCAFR
jgi:hypothetical protein